MSYLTPKGGKPTRATLSRDLGFKVPRRFAEYVCEIFDFAKGEPSSCLKAFEATLGLFACGANARYWGTPPELFPLGATGCDGDHYGFIVHAPELDLDELPFAHYCPMDSDGVIVVGSTTEQGIATVMARLLSYEFVSPAEKTLIAEVARRCNIRPAEEQRPTLSVPRGWRYLPSSDGIGTLAPAKLFSSEPVEVFDEYGPATPYVEAAQHAIKGGYLATTLHYLRQALWFNWVRKPYDVARCMVDVYHSMGRGQLAEELNRTMSKWTEAER